MLFAGQPGPIDEFREWLDARKARGERVQSIADASPQIRASADRAGRFLSLSSLVSVLLAAIAVAMAAQRYARRHLDTVALMKCMGAPQRFVLAQTLLQLVVIAVVTSVIGTAIGYVAQAGIAWLLRTFDGAIVRLSTHPFGCRIVQRLLEHVPEPTLSSVVGDVLRAASDLLLPRADLSALLPDAAQRALVAGRMQLEIALEDQPVLAQAIDHAVQQAALGDVVLLAGKGHEDTQDVAGVKRPFLDAAQAQAALAQRASGHSAAASTDKANMAGAGAC
jgi:hypothetical protein